MASYPAGILVLDLKTNTVNPIAHPGDLCLATIDGLYVHGRRNPLFDGVTTRVIVGSDLFYMADIQDEKESGFDPLIILKLQL